MTSAPACGPSFVDGPRICSCSLDLLAAGSSDMTTVDALAQLALEARRLGLELRLVAAPAELLDLIAFAGLTQALGAEVQRHTEEREEPLGVKEERELGDPSC